MGVCGCVCMCVCLRVCAILSVHVCLCMCMYACVCVRLCVYICVCVCVYVCVCTLGCVPVCVLYTSLNDVWMSCIYIMRICTAVQLVWGYSTCTLLYVFIRLYTTYGWYIFILGGLAALHYK